ncbi:dipeptidase [Blastopirellula sp. J2-11]|uniref:dipeptidase n=1 Tax=Blastopirellula sp. J2-11 TaxID=2943192 RepID=UPI0021C97DE1|nr:dipeptidase [Blastopirellula sp. J2-11]UUO08023.1 dipeptidase [Blastopirellula sp. J2-11]
MNTDSQTRSLSRRQFLSMAAASATLAAARPLYSAIDPTDRDPWLLSQNPTIALARESGLEVLKPTPAEIATGLSLHRRSLVFDSYGFAPRAALDAPRLTAAIEAGASDVELQDLQEDLSMTQATVEPTERQEFDEALRCSGVTAIFQNAGEEGQDPLRLMKRLARFTYLTDRMRGTLVRATVPADIEAAHRAGQHCLYLTGNGVPLPASWISVDEELSYIRLFYQLGVRMMHVTYNRRNLLGDGCAETANGGLSDLGRAAIAEMNRVGVIVDVAHSGWRTSLEASQASQKPMVASHTVCAGLRNHIRAKPDEVIRAICDGGGLIGICWIPAFLGGGGDLSALLDHIDYAVKRFGADHVAIGTDVAHTSQYAAAANQKIPKRPRRRQRYEALWPSGALGGHWPRAASLGWTNWPLVTIGLIQRGYQEADIQKILGQNMLRVCRAQANAERLGD